MTVFLGFSAETIYVSLKTDVPIPYPYYVLAGAMVMCSLGGPRVKSFLKELRKLVRGGESPITKWPGGSTPPLLAGRKPPP